MTRAGMILLGVSVLGAGAAIVYTMSEARAKRGTTNRPQALDSLASAACASDARGDRDNFLLSVQSMGTLLDGNAAPSLQFEDNLELVRGYQVATTAPSSFELCELVELGEALANNGHDYEAGQVLRIAVAGAA